MSVQVYKVSRMLKNFTSSPSICDNNKNLKYIIKDSLIVCQYIIHATENVSTNVTNTIPTLFY